MSFTTIPVLGFLQNLNPLEISVVVFLILLLFGAKRLPELGRGMGQFLKEFKKTTNQVQEDIRASLEEEPAPVSKPQPPVTKKETDPATPES